MPADPAAANTATRGHAIEQCCEDCGAGEGWSIVCECLWEAWGFATEEAVRAVHAAHVLDPDADVPVTVLA